MPKPLSQDPVPKTVKPYQFHGVSLNWKHPLQASNGRLYAMGDCPFCSKEGKFRVEIESGIYGCFKCEVEPGNISTFLNWLHTESIDATKEYNALSVNRGIINGVGLVQWGICKSIMTNDWLVPGYNPEGKLNQLYRYMWLEPEKRMVTMPTPLGHHGLHAVNLYKPDNLVVYLNEGWSDGVALYEILLQVKQDEDTQKLHLTGNPEKALINDCNVLACPTASVFHEKWLCLFAGKAVILMFDNDHARKHEKTGKPIDGAGYHHMKRIARMMSMAHHPPESISFLEWGELGYNPNLKNGYDVREHLDAKN